GRPSRQLVLVGITGTNGKTTTSYLVEALLRARGLATGVIGTVQYVLGAERRPARQTTPDALELQGMLALMRERGIGGVAMEVSSHALALSRVDGVAFDVAVFTNLTQDHLDFQDRKSTRLNSSHVSISYAVFCLKKKKHKNTSSPPALQTHSLASDFSERRLSPKRAKAPTKHQVTPTRNTSHAPV